LSRLSTDCVLGLHPCVALPSYKDSSRPAGAMARLLLRWEQLLLPPALLLLRALQSSPKELHHTLAVPLPRYAILQEPPPLKSRRHPCALQQQGPPPQKAILVSLPSVPVTAAAAALKIRSLPLPSTRCVLFVMLSFWRS